MLVLGRRENESIKIGDDIEVMVLSIRGDKVRIGITAPRDVPVHRDEIYRRILEMGELATLQAQTAKEFEGREGSV